MSGTDGRRYAPAAIRASRISESIVVERPNRISVGQSEAVMKTSQTESTMRIALIVLVVAGCVPIVSPGDHLDGGVKLLPDGGQCVPESAQETCVRENLSCGMQDGTDNCGAKESEFVLIISAVLNKRNAFFNREVFPKKLSIRTVDK